MGLDLPLFIGTLGTPEIVLVLLIAVLLFGANKIPKLARSTGQALGEFQRGREEIEQELQEVRQDASETVNEAAQDVEQTVESDTSVTDTTSTDSDSTSQE
ncbi:MAG: twin-arginine translocase TatA/TatE family subunit [Halobacteriaceae archaeon]